MKLWEKECIYVLNNKVVVPDGVTLTIEAGTIIKGTSGTGSLASALIIAARGGKIIAAGSASEQIVFTSTADNITVGRVYMVQIWIKITGDCGEV